MQEISALPLPAVRLHPQISDDALFGGLNLSETLATGKMAHHAGLLSTPATLILTMSERCTTHLAARLSMALNDDQGHCLIALDEGAEDDEGLAPALSDRLAFFTDLDGVALGDVTTAPAPSTARDIARVTAAPETIAQIAGLCDSLGIMGARAPLFALRAARAHAALMGNTCVTTEDIEAACALVLAHRATRWPEPAPETETPDTSPEEPPQGSGEMQLPDELILDAVRAMLPGNLLEKIAATKQRSAKGAGSGAKKQGNRRGRPLPARAGRLGSAARVDVVATLRAAAPWQTLRARARPEHDGLHIRPGDIHIKRYETQSDRLLIFAVDASGSAALARLGEAKGAIEIMLAQAYAKRDHVSLVAFRGAEAELLLPPTRSLVQTKRRLAALPGGGGTPLAAGLRQALTQADHATRRGLTPTIVLLTDGKANIALDGAASRAEARTDARLIARQIAATGTGSITIDTGQRPNPTLHELSALMGGSYLAMPRADAHRVSAAITTTLDA